MYCWGQAIVPPHFELCTLYSYHLLDHPVYLSTTSAYCISYGSTLNHMTTFCPGGQADVLYSVFGLLILVINLVAITVFIWTLFSELQAGLLAGVRGRHSYTELCHFV